jgi:hypothetical protein
MVDYSRHLLSYRFIYCKRAIPTPQSQEPCYYRIPDSFHFRYRRLDDLGVTPLCWPIAVALASSRDYRNFWQAVRACVRVMVEKDGVIAISLPPATRPAPDSSAQRAPALRHGVGNGEGKVVKGLTKTHR